MVHEQLQSLSKLVIRRLAYMSLLLSILFGCATIPYSEADRELQRRVTEAVRFAPELSGHNYTVEIQNSVVILHGSTDSGFERMMAGRIAARVEGVTHVYNRVLVYKSKSDR